MADDTAPRFDLARVKELCESAAKGDARALEELLGLYHRRFVGWLTCRIGADLRGKIDPDDVLQEAYIRAFQNISSFVYRHEDSFFQWCAALIDHAFLDRVRYVRRQRRSVAREASPAGALSRHEGLLDQHFADSLTPSRLMGREEALSALMSAIAQLPEKHRDVVRRLYLEREPLAQVAADLRQSPDAVRHLGTRALASLRRALRRASRFV